MADRNPFIGGDFEEFLAGQASNRERVQALTAKFVVSSLIERRMQELGITKTALAQRMDTSRAVVHRLLDEQDLSLTLATLVRACCALDMEIDFGALLRAAGAPAQKAKKAATKKPAARKAPARSMNAVAA